MRLRLLCVGWCDFAAVSVVCVHVGVCWRSVVVVLHEASHLDESVVDSLDVVCVADCRVGLLYSRSCI